MRFLLYALIVIPLPSICLNIILLGPPGAGKGTMAQYFVQNYDYVHISAGDLCRQEARKETPLGKEIAQIVKNGEYVNDALMFKMIAVRVMDAIAAGKPWIVDGYPRSESAFTLLDQFLEENAIAHNTICINLISEPTSCTTRIHNRLVCIECGWVYNTKTYPPTIGHNCNHCNTQLQKRSADTEPIISQRLLHWNETLQPLIGTIEKKYKVITITTETSYAELHALYRSIHATITALKE